MVAVILTNRLISGYTAALSHWNSGSICPDAMEDDGELSCDRDLGFLMPDPLCQLATPDLERRSPTNDIEQHVGCLKEIVAHQSIAMLGDAPGSIDLSGLVPAQERRQDAGRRG